MTVTKRLQCSGQPSCKTGGTVMHNSVQQTIDVGIELEFETKCRYCVYIMDGYYAMDYFIEEVELPHDQLHMAFVADGNTPPTPGSQDTSITLANIDLEQKENIEHEQISSATTKVSSQDSEMHDLSMTEMDSVAFSGINGNTENMFAVELNSRAKMLRIVEDKIIAFLRTYSLNKHCKIQSAGIGITKPGEVLPNGLRGEIFHYRFRLGNGHETEQYRFELPARLWLELDVLPFVLDTVGESIEERACSAVRKAVSNLSQGGIPRVNVGFRHEVEVDANGKIHLADLADYKATVRDETWQVLLQLATQTKQRGIKISFFNSTPQGGGVALMRHGIVRFLRLLNVDANWFVTKPRPEVFDVTKHKFHNILQGVAPKDARLTKEDIELYENWCRDNSERYWMDGPFKTSDVIILDDPQVAGTIPYIRAVNPHCRIIFRCHIEIRSDLTNDRTTPQFEVWNYLWENFIQRADLFVSHPVAHFVPTEVPREKLVMMPATSDQLDGLNKVLRKEDLEYYLRSFNRCAVDQVDKKVEFWNRPYIVQIARFDPSKGYPDVIRAYKLLRERMDSQFPLHQIPQLVFAGHGSIDDPDGALIYEQILDMLELEEFEEIAHDVIPVRMMPSDQLLNAILRGAKVAVQLSHREGFEIKITEALSKGIPVVAYAAGGIPHQIQHRHTGYLVSVGNVSKVAEHLYDLFHDESLYRKMSDNAKNSVIEEYFTVYNATNWLFLANEVYACSYPGGVHFPTTTHGEREFLDHELDDVLHCCIHDTTTEDWISGFDRVAEEDIPKMFEKLRIKLSGKGVWVKELWEAKYLKKGWRMGMMEQWQPCRIGIKEIANVIQEKDGKPNGNGNGDSHENGANGITDGGVA